jgi:aminoglycoside/choline kinase family phosphotransferase
MTFRLQEIKNWITQLFPTVELSKLNYIPSDASNRKYLRLKTTDAAFIIMDTVPGLELDNFIKIAKILISHNINVPQIIHCNLQQGLIMMHDFGAETYLTSLQSSTPSQIDSLYLDAMAALIKIQQIPTYQESNYELTAMDSAYISNRLDVFKTWYLQKHLGINIDPQMEASITKMQDIFTEAFTELPQVFTHVDYHCRNLMHVGANNPGILDFQDAMRGPVTYDLASLFQDAYITWPRQQLESWISLYKDMAIAAGIMEPVPTQALLRNFDLVGLQRHIKNLGIFARLHHRDQKSHYLSSIPTLLEYINTTCKRYSELNWILDFITEEALG